MLHPDQIINAKYRIVRLIGEGGMGSVYEARHEVLGHKVALKFLHPEIARQPSLSQRFLQEARLSAAIDNPHIVRVTDVDTAPNDGAFLVMELLHGESLQGMLERERRLDPERAVAFTQQLLLGLEAAHALGVVHRDLKPDNVFVTPSRQGPLLKILDFGIAKLRASEEYQMTLTRPGAVMGTPEYMAPEQAYSADLVDQRSDIYSVGVILFEMLSGVLPVEGDTPQQIAEAVLKGQVRRLQHLRPELPPELIEVVETSLMPDPDRRFGNVGEMRAALQRTHGSLLPRNSHNASVLPAYVPASGAESTALVPRLGTEMAGPSGLLTVVDRGSNVPKTLPPDPGPPPVTQQQPLKVKTASMPEAPALPLPTRTVGRRSSGGGFWFGLLGVVLLGGAAFGWYTFDRSQRPTPPAQPSRRVVTEPARMDLGAVEAEIDEEFFSERPVGRGGADSPRAGGEPPRVNPPPTFSLPSGITLPPLPSTLPSVPGLPFPLPGLPQPPKQAAPEPSSPPSSGSG